MPKGFASMIKLSNGMLAYRSTMDYSSPLWRVQLYWPELKVNKTEIHFIAKTIVRAIYQPGKAWGFGFQIFGFGCGVSWDA